jgi:hypothetical protein
MISKCCNATFNFFQNFYLQINKCIKRINKTQGYEQISPNINNEEHKPAKILSSEEINEMIKNQIKYSKEQTNSNGYKIIKQKNAEDGPKTGEMLNLEEIRNEINQIEFEEEGQKKSKSEKNNNSNNAIGVKDHYEEEKNNEEILDDDDNDEEDDTNLNIEELKKDVLESED